MKWLASQAAIRSGVTASGSRSSPPLTVFVSVADVRRALRCSRSVAYEHLRRARPPLPALVERAPRPPRGLRRREDPVLLPERPPPHLRDLAPGRWRVARAHRAGHGPCRHEDGRARVRTPAARGPPATARAGPGRGLHRRCISFTEKPRRRLHHRCIRPCGKGWIRRTKRTSWTRVGRGTSPRPLRRKSEGPPEFVWRAQMFELG